MTIVTQTSELASKKVLEVTLLQARLSKDGSDDDIKLAFSESAMKKANVSDRTARLKSLLRKGITAEQRGVLTENTDFIFDGDQLVSADTAIVVRIGSTRTVLPTTNSFSNSAPAIRP